LQREGLLREGGLAPQTRPPASFDPTVAAHSISERSSTPKQSMQSTQRGASPEEGDCGEDLQRAKLRLSTLHDDWVGTDLIGDIAAEETARGPVGLAARLRADGNEPDDSEPDPSPPRPSSPDDKPPIRKGSTGRVPWLPAMSRPGRYKSMSELGTRTDPRATRRRRMRACQISDAQQSFHPGA
jgi:hypothetical protein